MAAQTVAPKGAAAGDRRAGRRHERWVLHGDSLAAHRHVRLRRVASQHARPKIIKAIELKRSGAPLVIVSEKHWTAMLESLSTWTPDAVPDPTRLLAVQARDVSAPMIREGRGHLGGT